METFWYSKFRRSVTETAEVAVFKNDRAKSIQNWVSNWSKPLLSFYVFKLIKLDTVEYRVFEWKVPTWIAIALLPQLYIYVDLEYELYQQTRQRFKALSSRKRYHKLNRQYSLCRAFVILVIWVRKFLYFHQKISSYKSIW